MPPRDLPWRNVSWKVLESCNYRCTYCLQLSYKRTYPTQIEETVACIHENLGEKYEIKIAGGEIFSNCDLAIRLSKSITGYGHWVSLCTNLSADTQDYCQFIEATNGRIYTFGASLHLEYTDPHAFLIKCLEISSVLPPYAKIQVHNVITHGVDRIEQLGEIKKMFEDKGLIFYTDLLVDQLGKYHTYTTEEKRAIQMFLGTDEKLICHKNLPCRAGDSYFILTPELDAWTCWVGYYAKRPDMYLGNMRNRTFKNRNKISICPFDTCSCPTPILKHRYKLKTSE